MSQKTTLETRIQNKIDSEARWHSSQFMSLEGELYIYAPDDTHSCPRLKFGDGVNKVKDLPFVGNQPSDTNLTKVEYPVAEQTSFSYNAEEQFLVVAFDSDAIVHNPVSATLPGTYSDTFELKKGYCWPDGSTRNYTIEWVINKSNNRILINSGITEITYSFENVTFNEDGTLQNIALQLYNDASLTNYGYSIQYGGQTKKPLTATISDSSLIIDLSEENIGRAIVTISLPDNDYYNECSTSITITNNVAKPDLDECTWQQISTIAQRGIANKIWNIGDSKTITLEDGQSVTCFILDFDFCAGDVYVNSSGVEYSLGEHNTIDFGTYTTKDDNNLFGISSYEGKNISITGTSTWGLSEQYFPSYEFNNFKIADLPSILGNSVGADQNDTLLAYMKTMNYIDTLHQYLDDPEASNRGDRYYNTVNASKIKLLSVNEVFSVDEDFAKYFTRVYDYFKMGNRHYSSVCLSRGMYTYLKIENTWGGEGEGSTYIYDLHDSTEYIIHYSYFSPPPTEDINRPETLEVSLAPVFRIG